MYKNAAFKFQKLHKLQTNSKYKKLVYIGKIIIITFLIRII